MYTVRPLRLGNFRAVLEMVGDEAAGGDAPRDPGPPPPLDGLWRGSAQLQYAFDHLADSASYVSPGRLSELYRDGFPEETEPKDKHERSRQPDAPRWRCDKEAIVAELRLHSGLRRSDLHRIRRDFAQRNHPDRVPPPLRELATRRMTIANALIDCALKERSGKSG